MTYSSITRLYNMVINVIDIFESYKDVTVYVGVWVKAPRSLLNISIYVLYYEMPITTSYVL